MACYEHLKVYHDCYKLVLYFYQVSINFAKPYRYGLVSEIQNNLDRVLTLIILANNHYDKKKFLEKANLLLEITKVKVRLLYDLKIINKKRYGFISAQIVNLAQQMVKWQKWSQKGETRV